MEIHYSQHMYTYATAALSEADGDVTYSCYWAVWPTESNFVVDIEQDNEVVDRQLFQSHDVAMNEFQRLVGIGVANITQDYRKQVESH